MSGCFVVYNKDNQSTRVWLWENSAQREQFRQRAIDLAKNITQPACVEEFINQPHAGVQVWPTQGETQ